MLHVLGLMQTTDGLIYKFDGQDVSSLRDSEKADFRLKNVGFVFQQSNLLENLSAEDNLIAPQIAAGAVRYKAKRRAGELLGFVGLSELAHDYPDTLSGGEEQRLALARAMANGADIILADEPTASLDSENTAMVLEMFGKLAHEMNKVVVIVSHDEKVAQAADVLYQISDKKLVLEQGLSSEKSASPGQNAEPARKKLRKGGLRFAAFYTKKRIGDKWFNRVFAGIMTVVTAFIMLTADYGGMTKANIEAILDYSSDRNVFMVNNIFEDGMPVDIDVNRSLTQEQIDEIAAIDEVESVLPFYSFSYTGLTVSESDDGTYAENPGGQSLISVLDGEKVLYSAEFKFEMRDSQSYDDPATDFSVEPFFPEDDIAPTLEYGKASDSPDAIYLDYRVAQALTEDMSRLIGKTIRITCAVPVKSYPYKIGVSIPGTEGIVRKETDATNYKAATFEGEIAGILRRYFVGNLKQRGGHSPNLIRIPYEKLIKIVEENKEQNPGEDFIPLMPSALMITAKSPDDAGYVASMVRDLSPEYSVEELDETSEWTWVTDRIDRLQASLTAMSAITITLVAVMFMLLYSLRSRGRKKETGTLKAIGVRKSEIVKLTLFELVGTALISYAAAVVIAVAVVYLSKNDKSYEQYFALLSFNGFSAAVGFVVSVLITAAAGIIPIYRAARVDPVEAIRRINK
jgi:ABC-type lipoprotein export system ATPase subunit